MNSINNSFRRMDPDLGIPNVSGFNSIGSAPAPQSGEVKGGGFFETLQNAIEETNADQLRADQSIKDIIAGKSKNIHETMLQIQKAELSLKTMMQVRNKILEAYKEIIRMQV